MEPIGFELLSEIRSRFDLKPWAHVQRRLWELQRTWKPFIKLSEAGLEYADEWDRPS